MKKPLMVLLGFLTIAGAHAGGNHGTPIDRPVDQVARTLQARLPALAVDGMCEVSREGSGWNFTIRLKAEKTWTQEVQVILRATGAAASEFRVQGVRIDGGLITSTRKADRTVTEEWTAKILELVEHPD